MISTSSWKYFISYFKKSISEEVKFLEHPVSQIMRLESFSVNIHSKQDASKSDCNNCLDSG